VLLGSHKATGQRVAVKVKVKADMSETDKEELTYELQVLHSLDHPHIIKLYELYDESDKVYIVNELVEGGELFDRIVARSKYSEKDARDIVRTLMETLLYMHEIGIVHRDLKPENLLLCSENDDTNVKIADFGFAKKISELKEKETPLGTLSYVAPEILQRKKYEAQPDIWSMGVIVYVLLVGYPPFYDKNEKKLQSKIRNGRYHFHEEYWKNKSPEAIDMIKKMLTVDHHERWTARQLLQHPWIVKDSEELAAKNMADTIVTMKKFNAKRRFRAAVQTIMLTERLKNLMKPSPATGAVGSGKSEVTEKTEGDTSDVEGGSSDVSNASIPSFVNDEDGGGEGGVGGKEDKGAPAAAAAAAALALEGTSSPRESANVAK
jgi:serine/threonine protein kinase